MTRNERKRLKAAKKATPGFHLMTEKVPEGVPGVKLNGPFLVNFKGMGSASCVSRHDEKGDFLHFEIHTGLYEPDGAVIDSADVLEWRKPYPYPYL